MNGDNPVPKHIVEAVRQRIAQSTGARMKSIEAIRNKRPMDAEPDPVRKTKRIQRVTGLKAVDAERLTDRTIKPEAMGLAGERRLGAERVLGMTADFVGISFLDLARTAANAVGRVAFRNGRPQGSGFLISPRLFLTNNHVISGADQTDQFYLEFNYELGIDGRPRTITRFKFAPQIFFATSIEDDLDFTLLGVGERVDGPGSMEDFGFCPLFDTPDRHTLGEFVNIVQHPSGDYKQVVLRENRLVWRSDNVLHYIADTEPGSSGSPVFNDQWEPVALHHWGEPFRDTLGPDGRPLDREVNEGIRISSIVKKLRSGEVPIAGLEPQLLPEAVKLAEQAPTIKPKVETKPIAEPKRSAAGQPAASAHAFALRTDEQGKLVLAIPVELPPGVSLPSVQPLTPLSGLAVSSGEAVQPDLQYSNRKGYKSKFLPGHEVPLPKFDDSHNAAPLKNDPDKFRLDYEHFSIVMNADRKMALFTATNVDGAKWIHILRKTGEPKEAAEATEKWFVEPRLDAKFQHGQDTYDDQRPRRLFDRGHLTRREDPNWGTNEDAIRANADTFHFTNCTPQASTFNQSAKHWQGIENYVIDNAKAEEKKVVVFTGPVFRSNDLKYRKLKVPRKFWKILVRVDQGELLATAFIADQSKWLKKLPESAGRIDEQRLGEAMREAFDDLGDIADYQTSVAEVEELTSLDFGVLRDHDTFDAEGPESTGGPTLLKRFEDVRLDPVKRKRRR